MVDLTSPNPLVMTHFELIAAVAATFAVVLAVTIDLWRTKRSGPRPPQR
jgi:hypothetical protein